MNIAVKPVTGKKVFFYFLAFFVAVVLANAVFITQALESFTGVVSESAYEDGLAYDKTLLEAKEQKALGLKESLVYENGALVWTIKDNENVPVTGAKVTAQIIRPLETGHDYEIEFTESAQGVYRAPLNAPLPGAWTVKADAKWNTHNYQTVMEITAR